MMSECAEADFQQYVHQRFHDLANASNTMLLSVKELNIVVERLDTVTEQNAEILKRLFNTIEGNGRPGLKADVAELTHRIDGQSIRINGHDEAARLRAAELKQKAESQRWMLRWILGIVGTLLTTGTIALSSFAWAQYKQVRSLIDNQATLSRQVQQLPGAKPSTPVVQPQPSGNSG